MDFPSPPYTRPSCRAQICLGGHFGTERTRAYKAAWPGDGAVAGSKAGVHIVLQLAQRQRVHLADVQAQLLTSALQRVMAVDPTVTLYK